MFRQQYGRSMICSLFFLLVLPASTNYQLRDYGFGSGGADDSQSANYAVLQITGEPGDLRLVGTTYQSGSGLIFTNQANVPAAPTFVNDQNSYNRLKFTLAVGSDPSDSEYAIAISTNDFATTNYVQNDNTIAATLGSEDWQTYAAWGGATGEFVIGLAKSTTYKIKVKARQGDFTETDYSPTASATTSANASLTFDLDVAATDTESAPPYTLALGTLTPGTVATSSNRVWIDFTTNAVAGGSVFVLGANGGLTSAAETYTIGSATADLATAGTGVGIQIASATQTSGGPLTSVSPFNGSGDNVGAIPTALRELVTTSAPLTGGRASFRVKAKVSRAIPEATDYSETLTIVAAGAF